MRVLMRVPARDGRRRGAVRTPGPGGSAALRLLRLVLVASLCAPVPAAGDASPAPEETGGTEEEAGGAGAAGEGRPANRLIDEKSPYLLQHARNPVDWYPWGDEAFAKAREEDRPVLVSIGYSTCHWCHVMERESFEDEEVAAFLNEHFVAIKVDREERPDVDAAYMRVCQALNRGRGGWPLTVIATPEGDAFFAGTYFPRDQFLQLLRRILELWEAEESHQRLVDQAERITGALRRSGVPDPGEEGLRSELAARAYSSLAERYDETHGGFGEAPKFPQMSNIDFLLRHARRTGEERAGAMVRGTLDAILRGGIRDHLAGGFHRYSTDRRWLVPHFEKMLYDNALIARSLVDAGLALDEPRYLSVARETLDWMLERMRSPQGAFHSAKDADTEGREGATYLWTREEVLKVLGEERGRVVADFYGVTEEGNFTEPRGDGPTGHSVLHVTREGGVAEYAGDLGRPVGALRSELARAREELLRVREGRPQPALDDKVLVEWNGYAISALARAAQATGEERYGEAAREAARFILDTLVVDGRLHRRFREGDVAVPAFLADHVALAEGLLDLWETDFDPRWLRAARRLGRTVLEEFRDAESGVFRSTAEWHDDRIDAPVLFHDGAVPSANATAYLVLLRLRELAPVEGLDDVIAAFERAAATAAAENPASHTRLLCGLEYRLHVPVEVVLVGAMEHPRTQAFLAEVRGRFLPSRALLWAEDDEEATMRASLAPLLEHKRALGGDPTAYVCRRGVCELPARDTETFAAQLDAARPEATGEADPAAGSGGAGAGPKASSGEDEGTGADPR